MVIVFVLFGDEYGLCESEEWMKFMMLVIVRKEDLEIGGEDVCVCS